MSEIKYVKMTSRKVSNFLTFDLNENIQSLQPKSLSNVIFYEAEAETGKSQSLSIPMHGSHLGSCHMQD